VNVVEIYPERAIKEGSKLWRNFGRCSQTKPNWCINWRGAPKPKLQKNTYPEAGALDGMVHQRPNFKIFLIPWHF
ncbi:hypothetical protein HAX54_043865, partial [Datura stramonium]|nr:hypothetical protein [Datura stramonium]